MKFATIKLSSTSSIRKTYVGVNGKGRYIPHNKEVEVNEFELEVLQNSPQHGVTLEIVTALADAPADPPNLDAEREPEHDREQGETGRPSPAPPGAQKGKTAGNSAGRTAGKRAGGGKPAEKAAAAAAAEAEAEKAKGTGEADTFDAAAFLDRTIDEMGFDDLDADQVAALIEAEKAKDDPRSTLIEKLEARAKALADAPAE